LTSWWTFEPDDGQPAAVKDQLLKTFGSLEKLEEYATGVDDKEILS
jgi:hypothetical protein